MSLEQAQSLEQALRAHSQQRREALAHAVRRASTAPATAARLAGAGLTADAIRTNCSPGCPCSTRTS